MRSNPSQNLTISTILFILLLITGYLLSQQKLLWLDEIFTQSKSIDACSYTDIILGRFSEGNKNPLFYIIQKAISDTFSYKLPIAFTSEIIKIHDNYSQVIIRAPSNVYMSFAIVLIFYFFLRYYSLSLALYSLAILLTTPMVWMYWVEARPYSLWFLLTTIQLLIFCRLLVEKQPNPFKIRILFITHLLLSLTTIASIFQIFIVSFLLLRSSCRKQLLWISLIPLSIAFYYYFTVHVYTIKAYYFWPHLIDAILPEHIPIYILYGLFIGAGMLRKKKTFNHSYFFLIFLLFLSSICFILWIYMHKTQGQFGFSNRYLIYMVPVDVLMFSFLTHDFLKLAKAKTFVWINVLIFFTGLLIVRSLVTYTYILVLGLYLHTPS